VRTLLVIPCYNEAARLPVAALRAFVDAEPTVDLLLVDDGSTDGTRAVLEGLATGSAGRIAMLGLDRNGGKAEAVRRGMLEGLARQPEAIGYWDADLATPLEELARFVAVLEAQPAIQLVMGARVKLLGRAIERSLHRHYLGRVFATAASNALGLSVYDTQCGAKLFRHGPGLAELFETPFRSRWVFDVELLFRFGHRLQRRGLGAPDGAIYELPLLTWHDVAGSKVRPRDFFRAFFELLSIRLAYGGLAPHSAPPADAPATDPTRSP
jgi:glycosyltransferase involved in cell wall biosynthesis